ncbi:MAG: hypothetical protein O6762_01900 [Thaumarchaeota archaeon]|nr:hypothetical protein [Nitrososphaerota archaeon]
MPTVNKTSIRNLTILLGSTMTVLAGALLAPALPDMAEAFRDVPNAEFMGPAHRTNSTPPSSSIGRQSRRER